MVKIGLKRGSTFSMKGTYSPVPGALESLTGAVVTSQVRKGGALVRNIDVEVAPDGMSFAMEGGDTTDWPLGLLEWDVRIELDGVAIYTDTVLVDLLKNVTQP